MRNLIGDNVKNWAEKRLLATKNTISSRTGEAFFRGIFTYHLSSWDEGNSVP